MYGTKLDNFQASLAAAKDKLNSIIDDMKRKWEMHRMPNFLRSAAMTHASWEILKLKYENKIWAAYHGHKPKFVVSFMGSSVTAGHDTAFNITFPSLTEDVMSPVFSLLGIEMRAINAAMGNNPCLPYDLCVHAFAGKDADIVHWEQSYNCFGSDPRARIPFEHFIRQSLSLPNQPVVVFSKSVAPNWNEDACKDRKDHPDKVADDEGLFERFFKDPEKVVAIENRNDKRHLEEFPAMTDLFKYYKLAGIQSWVHSHYEVYKCHGPYSVDWGCCSAGWHPSIKGHRVIADHYSLIWLLILRDAISELQSFKDNMLEEHMKLVHKHTHELHKFVPPTILYPSNFTHTLECYTSFQTLENQHYDLFNLVIPIKNNVGKLPFQSGIMEDFINTRIVIKAREQGYRDYKRMMYGNNESAPLSLRMDIKNEGYVHICEPPGNWGVLPKGFKSLYKDFCASAFVTSVDTYDNFEFDLAKAKEIVMQNVLQNSPCSTLDTKFSVGKYVLTIVPLRNESVMVSYLILP